MNGRGSWSRCWIQVALLNLLLATPVITAVERSDSLASGLLWVRFDACDFSRLRDTGVSGQVNVDTGTDFNDYSQFWVGLIEIPSDLPITFIAEADNGLRLMLGGTLVIDGWEASSPRRGEFQADVASRVPLRLEYFQQGGVGHLRLYWQWGSRARELVPASAFFHTADQQEFIAALLVGKTPLGVREDLSVIYQPEAGIPGRATGGELPVPAHPGPHLLLDDYLIADSTGLERVVLQPQRDPTIPNPIVTGREDGCFQPYLTVLHDPEVGRWRMWYGARRADRNPARSHLATMSSEDGIHFTRPHRICDTPEIQFGSEVIDRGAQHADTGSRYVYSYWMDGGLRLLTSADGLKWRPLVQGVVLPHNHDIVGIDWDPLRQMYVATASSYTTGPHWTGARRTTMMSFSRDLIHWQPPWFVLTASDQLDQGETQFYAMDGYLTRGSLRIGMVKILRDDLQATGTQPGSFGRAYTSLAWSRDGRAWVRDRAPFFEPDDDPGAWDHAHAWIDEQVIIDDQVYLYYGGYKQGHKVNRFEERQIGLIRMPVDRYIARRARGAVTGRLTTVPIIVDEYTRTLQVNANAAAGELRAQVRDAASGHIVPGMSFDDCQPIKTDGLYQTLRWPSGDWSVLAGKPVQLEWSLSNADLFAFSFVPAAAPVPHQVE